MTLRSSIQVTVSDPEPEVVQIAVDAIKAELEGLPHLTAHPLYIREAAIFEIYTKAESPEVLAEFEELIVLVAKQQYAVTSVVGFVQND